MIHPLTINCDGGARGNPGPAAIGFVIRDDSNATLVEDSAYIGIATNNQAEYTAILHALQKVAELTNDTVHVFMDSQLLVRQLQGKYRVKSASLQHLFAQVKREEARFQTVTYQHTSRETQQQKAADQLVNVALDAAMEGGNVNDRADVD